MVDLLGDLLGVSWPPGGCGSLLGGLHDRGRSPGWPPGAWRASRALKERAWVGGLLGASCVSPREIGESWVAAWGPGGPPGAYGSFLVGGSWAAPVGSPGSPPPGSLLGRPLGAWIASWKPPEPSWVASWGPPKRVSWVASWVASWSLWEPPGSHSGGLPGSPPGSPPVGPGGTPGSPPGCFLVGGPWAAPVDSPGSHLGSPPGSLLNLPGSPHGSLGRFLNIPGSPPGSLQGKSPGSPPGASGSLLGRILGAS